MGCCHARDDKAVEITSVEKKKENIEEYQVKYKQPNSTMVCILPDITNANRGSS